MAVVGAAAGYCYAVSLRLSIAGLSVALSLLISQGLPLDAADALPALVFATAGGLLQAALLAARLRWPATAPRRAERKPGARRAAIAALRANWTLRSASPPATRSASAARSPPGSPPTGCSGWRTTASGSR